MRSTQFFRLITLSLFVTFSYSCNRDSVYHDVYTFKDYTWNPDESAAFTIEIKPDEAGKKYHLMIEIRYITGFSRKFLDLGLIMKHPDGSQGSKEMSIQLISDDRKYRGEGMGDIWDFDYQVSEPLIFEKSGNYEIELVSLMGKEPVYFINELGIELKKMSD